MNKFFCLFLSSFLVGCGGGGNNGSDGADNYKSNVENNVEYGSYGTNKLQNVELHKPLIKTKSPLLIWIHGGGWQHGDKNEEKIYFDELVKKHNIAVLNVNYRLNEDGEFPNSVNDVETILNLVNNSFCDNCLNENVWQKANDYSKNGIMVAGMSAGGYLALKSSIDYLSKNKNKNIQCVNNITGPVSFSRYVNSHNTDYYLYEYLYEYLNGDLRQENIQKANVEESLERVEDKSNMKNIKWYLTYNIHDKFFPYEDTVSFKNYLNELNFNVKETVLKYNIGGGHNVSAENVKQIVLDTVLDCFKN